MSRTKKFVVIAPRETLISDDSLMLSLASELEGNRFTVRIPTWSYPLCPLLAYEHLMGGRA